MSDEQTPLPPEPSQEEPTVLDLFKLATRDWNSFLTTIRSLNDAERLAEVERAAVEEAHHQAEVAVETEGGAQEMGIPWRMLGAILLALFAQLQLEPPSPRIPLALGLYALALGLALWAYFVHEWRLPSLQLDQTRQDPMTLRIIPLLLSVVLTAVAFFNLS